MIVPSRLIATVPLAADAAVTDSVSPSGSLSFASTFIVTGTSSLVDAISLAATGAGLVTVQMKVVETMPPLPSSAVIVTEYSPPFTWLAPAAIVPVISPVVWSILRPVGSPIASYVSVSPSISLKKPVTGKLTGDPSRFARSGTGPTTGASFTGVITIVAVAVEKPPLLSVIK